MIPPFVQPNASEKSMALMHAQSSGTASSPVLWKRSYVDLRDAIGGRIGVGYH